MKDLRIAVLGSTGSVGKQALDVAKEIGARVLFLSAGRNIGLLAEQIKTFSPEAVCVLDKSDAEALRRDPSVKAEVFFGDDGLLSCIKALDADVIVHSISGLAGVAPAVAAAEKGCRIAMANKEAIISAGRFIFNELSRSGGEMIPVDSEHSAIFQCLAGNRGCELKKIFLTASGGPFYGYTKEMLRDVTAAEALDHPTWNMGPKITVDCATMMNKGFEIIEAVRLFGVPEDKVEVLIHRQSIIHSMVEYTDNTVMAQMALPDMRYCIRFAFSCPGRFDVSGDGIDFASVGSLTFDRPDTDVFPLLDVAREAVRREGVYPTALIAADEVAVESFIEGKLSFDRIPDVVTGSLGKIRDRTVDDPYQIAEIIEETKNIAKRITFCM